MAISLIERKEKSREKRSRAITSKINLLKTRDGSTAPPIESQKDLDLFNLKMLFGVSGNESMDWAHIGVEGLIRAYYYVVQKISGITRNNIVTNENISVTTEGCLDDAANKLLAGTGDLGGFYSTNPNDGRRGIFDPARSAFNSNRTGTPATDDNIIARLNTALAVIGSRSPLHPGGFEYDVEEEGTHQRATFANLVALGAVYDSILGRRFSDICPEIVSMIGGENPVINGYRYGNGIYDLNNQTGPSDYTADNDYYNPALNANLTVLKSLIDAAVLYLQYAKIEDPTYFANIGIIPYKSETPSYSTIDGWIAQLNNAKSIIIQYESDIANYWISGYSAFADMHGLIANKIYTFSASVYIPAGNILGSEIIFELYDYLSGWVATSQVAANTYNAWQTVTLTRTLRANCTSTIVRIKAASAAKEDECFYVDDIVLNQSDPGYPGMARGDCESTTSPMVDGETTPYIVDATWARSNERSHSGSYSYKFTKTSAKNNEAYVNFVDNNGTAAVTVLLDNLKTNLSNIRNSMQSINDAIDSTAVLGTVGDPSTLRGVRFLWIKTILDPAEGSKVALKGIETALASIGNSITQAEEEFGIFGINRVSVSWAASSAWNSGLPTSEIVGIETYATIDSNQNSSTFGEMIITGYIVAWNGSDHATAYNVWKSLDWSGSTGTWTQIIPSGNNFTVEDIDLNNGKVLSYYIDLNVNPNLGEKPYYKVIAYDSGGSGDYSRIPSCSAESGPKSYDDFLSTGSVSPFVGPSGPPPSQPGEVPPYLFKWTTIKNGNESLDNPLNTEFQSDAAFDSVGSNLEVFVDGKIRHKGAGSDEYTIVSDQKIKFNSQISDSLIVTLIVYFGAGGSSGSNFWKNPVATASNLPNVGNTNGDIRLVLDENMLYTWETDLTTWTIVKSSTTVDIAHADLSDMPDLIGINPDHDERYPTKVEVNTQLSEIQSQINALQFLIPEDAVPLGGALQTSGVNFYTGYLSGGLHRFDTLQAKQVFAKIINDATFEITLPADNQFANADVGTIRLYINNIVADYFDLGTHFDEANRSTGQVYTPDWGPNHILKITEVAPYLGYADHQKGNFTIYISPSLLVAGENKIQISHSVSPEERWSDAIIVFYDNATNSITFDNIFVNHRSIISAKYLSGVRHYSTGDKLRFRFSSHNLFDNTYSLPNQFDVNLSEFGAVSYSDNFTSTYVTSITNAQVGDALGYDRDSTVATQGVYNIQPVAKLIGRDPFGASTQFTSSIANILINTYSYLSDDKHEYFVDERYRLPVAAYSTIPSSFINLWNSNAALTSSGLQVYHRRLVYPQINFSNNYLPSQTIDYSGFSGARYYVRAFVDSGKPHNNGIFFIPGFIISNANVKINIKLPSKTGWLDLCKSFNEADFTGADGDGCLTLQAGANFSWTSGNFSTAESGYMVIVRVQMLSSLAPSLEGLSIDW